MHSDGIGDQLAEIASGIRNDVPNSDRRLFAVLGGGIRALLARQVRDAEDIDHSVHECVRAVASSIRGGTLREPGAIISYALTLTRHQVAGLTGGVRQKEENSRQSENVGLFGRALLRLSKSDRELLRLFYSHTESDQEIRQALGLTEVQFRLKLSHAKRKLTEEVQQLKRRREPGKLLAWFTDRRKDS